ncbi:MAG TPA: SDR family oxidoreductase [Symbiobacteriaceae bacterium]|nr:SDR family oxidoreductase [Symbiobacteriaceae bacterium]
MAQSMSDKICMVTGANSGIGKVTALELARKGATVIMVCRDRGRAEPVLAEIRQATGNSRVELMIADLSSQQSIRQLADGFKAKYDRLHVLVNNAGAILFQRTLTPDGLETTFAVNHLGGFLLTNLLLDTIKASAPARIINVSSGAHVGARIHFDDLQAEKSFSAWRAYGQSKLANILFTVELTRRLEGTGVTANALHPGFVRSNFAGTSRLAKAMIGLMQPFTISPEQGAETSIYLASSPDVEGVTGKYFVKCRPVKSTRASTDPETARRLWQVSEQLTGL